MARKQASVLVGMAMAAILLAGCGTGSVGAVRPVGATAVQAGRPGPGGPGFAGRSGPGVAAPAAVVIDLKLTDDQKAQLKAIAEKYKPAQPPQNDLHTLLTADTVDEGALRSALQAIQTFQTTQREAQLAMLSETRAVYTDDQRTTIIAGLQSMPEPKARPAAAPQPAAHPDVFADIAAKLQLTDEQKAILDTMKPKSPLDRLNLNDEQKAALDALKPQAHATKPDPAAQRQAEISFWQTGDTALLKALVPTPVDMTDAVVQAATVLTAEQRKAILGRGLAGPGFAGPVMVSRTGPVGPAPRGPQGPGRGTAAKGAGFQR